jgi:hypothetical protein
MLININSMLINFNPVMIQDILFDDYHMNCNKEHKQSLCATYKNKAYTWRNNKKNNCTRLDNGVCPNSGLCLLAHFSVKRLVYYLKKNWHKHMVIPQFW